MRRFFPLLSAGVMLACTSAQQPAAAPVAQQNVRIPATNGGVPVTMTVTRSTSPASQTVAGSADAVWSALPAVYAALSIPIEQRDATSRSLGNPAYKVRRRLGDVALSKYVDCGSAQGAPSADTYEIVLSVATHLQAISSDSTSVTTVIDGRGRPAGYPADYVNCGTRGQLEKRFFDLLALELRR